jgi:hypothetical protein
VTSPSDPSGIDGGRGYRWMGIGLTDHRQIQEISGAISGLSRFCAT